MAAHLEATVNITEKIARAICEGYGGAPDELVRLSPAGPAFPYWKHFEGLAQLTKLWLLRFKR